MSAKKESFKQHLGSAGTRVQGGKGGSLARRLINIGRRVEKAAWDAQRMAALAVDQAVVLGTPVDTGRARSNWRVSTGSPLTGTIEPYAPGHKMGMGESGNATGAIQQALSALKTHKGGSDIWISNNVHYIGKLERGHSPQNEAWVKAAVLEGKVLLKTFTLLSLRRRFSRGH